MITGDVIDLVEKFGRANVKELIRIMQIDQQFIPRMCRYLIRKADLNPAEPSNLSVELQLLSLVMLRELMQTPLEEFEKRTKK